MDNEITNRKDQDLGRGVALMVAGAVMVLLKFVLPVMAPIVLAGYGIYRLFMRGFMESAIVIAVALVLWFLQGLVGWLLLILGAGMTGIGLFYLIRGVRGQNMIE